MEKDWDRYSDDTIVPWNFLDIDRGLVALRRPSGFIGLLLLGSLDTVRQPISEIKKTSLYNLYLNIASEKEALKIFCHLNIFLVANILDLFFIYGVLFFLVNGIVFHFLLLD